MVTLVPELKIIIRCKNASTKKEFRQFILDNDFRNSEEALLFLLRKARELGLKPERGYAVL
jgi:hypothetical protein